MVKQQPMIRKAEYIAQKDIRGRKYKNTIKEKNLKHVAAMNGRNWWKKRKINRRNEQIDKKRYQREEI